MKEALQQYKKKHLQATRRAIEAVLVGTRFGDPYSSNLKPFQMTDAGWPSMMRVHPILDWSYDDIWAFLRSEELGKGGVGWCKLYDYGYVDLSWPEPARYYSFRHRQPGSCRSELIISSYTR